MTVERRVEQLYSCWASLKSTLIRLFSLLLNVQRSVFSHLPFPLFSFTFRQYSELFKGKLKLMLITIFSSVWYLPKGVVVEYLILWNNWGISHGCGFGRSRLRMRDFHSFCACFHSLWKTGGESGLYYHTPKCQILMRSGNSLCISVQKRLFLFLACHRPALPLTGTWKAHNLTC